MQKQSIEKVKTFSIGFEQPEFNESTAAQNMAACLQTEHQSMVFTSNDALNLIPALTDIYDQPFADSSQLPTCLVAMMARQHVTVCLSGDGGDELFAGYDRYLWGQKILRLQKKFSPGTRFFLAHLLHSLSPSSWDKLSKWLYFLPAFKSKRMGDKIYKLAGALTTANEFDLYKSLASVWLNPDKLMIHCEEPVTALTGAENCLPQNDFIKQAQYIDQALYLPDDILHKVDRASMANSLEVRVPLLDHRVVQCSWKFTNSMNIIDQQGKAPLRQILGKYVPENLFNRPKMGFGVPIAAWLRGPLKTWAVDLLSEERLSKQGIFACKAVNDAWQAHASGRENHSERLWGLLILQSWLEKNN